MAPAAAIAGILMRAVWESDCGASIVGRMQ